MSEEIKIIYNNIDIFSGIGPTPFVSFSQNFTDFNTNWNQVTTITLQGNLTGKYLGNFSNQYLNESFSTLLSRLNQNYKNLLIKEGPTLLFSGNSVIIDSISVDESAWYGILPYTINIDVYEKDLFTNYYGVTSPEETISFTEGESEIVNLTHKISAVGIITENNTAIENAKNWVLSRTGTYQKIIPILVKTDIGSSFLLESIKENINRFNGEYSWEANYTKSNNSESPKNCLLNYSIDINSGVNDNLITCNIDGSLEKNNIQELRNIFNNLNFYNLANDVSQNTFNINLNNRAIKQSVNESEQENILNFSIIYNNDYDPNIINDYSVSIERDLLKNITNVNLSATIFGRYGDNETKWPQVKTFYENSFNAFTLANAEFIKEVVNRELFPNLLTESITFDEYNAQIKYTATWSDKRSPSSDIINFSSSIKYTPSIRLHAVNTSAFTAREHNIQNLNSLNRSRLEITVGGQAVPGKNISIVNSFIDNEISRIRSNFAVLKKPLLENSSETKNTDLKSVSKTQAWSFEGAEVQ